MKPEWCPQWAWDKAGALFDDIGFSIGGCGCDECREKWIPVCARSLLDAHQRGRREGMEEAASVARCAFDDRPRRDSMDWNDGFDDGTKAAEYAIRAKAQEVKT